MIHKHHRLAVVIAALTALLVATSPLAAQNPPHPQVPSVPLVATNTPSPASYTLQGFIDADIITTKVTDGYISEFTLNGSKYVWSSSRNSYSRWDSGGAMTISFFYKENGVFTYRVHIFGDYMGGGEAYAC